MLYTNRCTLEINGAALSDLISFTETSRVRAKTVNLMHKTGFARMTERYLFSIEVKKPYTGEMDLDNLSNATVTVQYDNGQRILFRGVESLETGDGAIDGETELTYTKQFGATNREEEN